MMTPPPPPPTKIRRALRVVGWNAVLLMAGLALIGLAGEAWLRSTIPFVMEGRPQVFVPGVGVLLPPDTEVRSTNMLDFWTVSRTNSLGFLDREPPSPERAAESCHVTMIGDSFVESREVPIPEKFHVRIEEMAARELPHLAVTTSAFGYKSTGTTNQLAFYDEYVRPLRPRLVVLVFVPNDYVDNFARWLFVLHGWDPEHLPYLSAARTEDGGFRLRPPDPEYRRFRLPRLSDPSAAPQWQWRPLVKRALRASWLLSWLQAKRVSLFRGVPSFFALFQEGTDSPFYEEALAFTSFGLDQFKERAVRDGATLVILATHQMHRFGGGTFARMSEMAAERGIPVIDQGDYIHRQGAELDDAGWAHDDHWSPTGHRFAAEALLEYLKRNQDVCE